MALPENSIPRACRRDPRFTPHYDPWVRTLLKLIPGARERSSVDVSDEEMRVRIRPFGEVRIPRNTITRVWRTRARDQGILFWLPPLFIAHSNFRGVWWLNGSLANLVAIDIEPPATGRIWRVSVRPRRVVVSLEDPEDFIAEMLG